jgi:hypothetical protein
MEDFNVNGTVEKAAFPHHFLWFFLQLIFSAPGVMIASLPFWAALDRLRTDSAHQPGKLAGYEALLCLYVAVPVGWWMARRLPLLAVTGRWIWVLPAGRFAVCDSRTAPAGLSSSAIRVSVC